ncbi:minor tail protein L [Caudoviricetes sp.]|nr:minor tail protein L [Caudoviricetes sp.]
MSEHDSASNPIETYEFQIEGFGYIRLTSDELTLTAEGKVYTPQRGLSRSAIACVITSDAQPITVTLPADSTLARRVAMFETPKKTTLTFRRYQRDDLSTPTLYFKAVLNGASIQGETCELKFPDVLNNAMAGNLPKNVLQSQCNWNLGDANCKIVPTLLMFEFRAARLIPNAYFQDCEIWCDGAGRAASFLPASAWAGGVVRATRNGSIEERTINYFTPSGPAGNYSLTGTMVVNAPFSFPIDDRTTLKVVKVSCDNTYNSCRNKFDNLARFSGFPWTPTEKNNPFLTRIDLTRKP